MSGWQGGQGPGHLPAAQRETLAGLHARISLAGHSAEPHGRLRGLFKVNERHYVALDHEPYEVQETFAGVRIVGPEHRVDVITALKAMTIWPAWQHFEEKSKGSIETGKLADFVILDKDPLKVEPMAIKDIKVMETIKEGETVMLEGVGGGFTWGAVLLKM